MTNEEIIQISGVSLSECSCNSCKSMCMTASCVCTPTDAARLILAGYRLMLAETVIVAPSVIKQFGKPMKAITPLFKNGRCCMLNDDNLCRLHDKGLKPLEGRLAHHSIHTANVPPLWLILKQWDNVGLNR